MKKYILLILLSFLLLFCCKQRKRNDLNKENEMKCSEYINEESDEDSENNFTYEDILNEYFNICENIPKIDTLVDVGNGYYRIIQNHYSLNDTLIVPKKYDWREKPKDFLTHNFASEFILINNEDTLLKREIKKSDFSSLLDWNLSNYAILFPPSFDGFNDSLKVFQFYYNICIPITDIGIDVKLSIDLQGNISICK